MIKNGRQKEIRHYVGAIGIFIFVVGILTFLSFQRVFVILFTTISTYPRNEPMGQVFGPMQNKSC